mmetsp:Transcript_50956/g.143203  ORF Transcript_50956/g.143203 Transcript_50956/m.143203 type:complete len:615 (-) Transcript_50956:184-2028(-)
MAGERRRTSKSIWRLRCIERPDIGNSLKHPVRLVIFDFDETLTLVTLMTSNGTYAAEQLAWAREVNFETPWVEGSRVEKLHNMLSSLANGKDGEQRVLAILTRNGSASGVSAVINLMKAAELDVHFACVWSLPSKPSGKCGAYQIDGEWHFFDPPVRVGHDHKADVLQRIAKDPSAWFPQMAGGPQTPARLTQLSSLKLEQIVLVDDQRGNFQSESGAHVLRYCKVARYDADYRTFGFMRDMGGIGAHDDADYDALKRFVEDPWMCKDTFCVRCQERPFDGGLGNSMRQPVNLVVFDFDETLTMATFMPGESSFSTEIGWAPQERTERGEWSKSDLVEYNFESPYVEGSRVEKLQAMLKCLSTSEDGSVRRTLAILTKNEQGVVAVLNLLTLAGLADYFSAIWTIPARKSIPNGAYRDANQWKSFDPPVDQVHDHKADVLHSVASDPTKWFPQLQHGNGDSICPGLRRLRVEGIVLVDDERANFRSNSQAEAKVMRYCKVARYDEVYRDCGALNQMGGIGAHSDSDFETLKSFVERPWECPYENLAAKAQGIERGLSGLLLGPPAKTDTKGGMTRSASASHLSREASASEEPEPPKAPRVRKAALSNSPPLRSR